MYVHVFKAVYSDNNNYLITMVKISQQLQKSKVDKYLDLYIKEVTKCICLNNKNKTNNYLLNLIFIRNLKSIINNTILLIYKMLMEELKNCKFIIKQNLNLTQWINKFLTMKHFKYHEPIKITL